jgi:hypothetical protein
MYRNGHCYTIGTFHSEAAAAGAYESALINENPDLHAAPERVERPSSQGPVQGDNPDAG